MILIVVVNVNSSGVSNIWKNVKNTANSNVMQNHDRCGDQHKNQFFATKFMISVQELENISMIDMEFLVPGHTQMECDSMHSAISTKLLLVGKESWPEDLEQIARSARRKGDKPYQVKNLSRTKPRELEEG
ncbi:hypothetical protein JTB14_033584 [Gonioctena quinquepunctata]|nr:hypothetical protein JTB14_033584 [Gonioctena quinquepunctata]